MHLLAGVHDPESRMVSLIHLFKKVISQFESTTLAITPNTTVEMKNALRELDVKLIDADPNAGKTRKDLLAYAKDYILMSDFDKLVHIQQYYPEEINLIKNLKPEGLLVLGRTQKGFSSCPQSWTKTELPVNHKAAEILNLPKIDICCGPFVANEKIANIIFEKAKIMEGWSCLSEYPLIAKKFGIKIEFLELPGLEWEDPDRYSNEIKLEGYESWVKRVYDSPQEWEKRKQAAEVMMKVLLDYPINL